MGDTASMRRLLHRWGTTIQRVREAEQDIQQLQEAISALYSTGPDGVRITAPYERTVEAIGEEIRAALLLKSAIDDVQSYTLSAMEQNVLWLRYVDGMKWAQIGNAIGLTEKSSMRIETQALEQLQCPVKISGDQGDSHVEACQDR